MTLVLRPLNSGSLPNNKTEIPMHDGVLTIGRGDENDLSLPDPDRLLSKRHCVLEERNGDYVLIDTSTNGTFLNYGSERIGNIPTPLNHGDVLQLGRFELVVEIYSETPPSAEPLPPAQDSLVLHGPSVVQAGPTDLDDPLDNGSDAWDSYFDEPLDRPRSDANPSGWNGPAGSEDPLDWKDPLDAGVPFDDYDLLGSAQPHILLEDDFSAPISERGASEADHSATEQDYFPAPSVKPALIPDDWDSPQIPMGTEAQASSMDEVAADDQSPDSDPLSAGDETDPLDDFLSSEPDDLTGKPTGPFDASASAPVEAPARAYSQPPAQDRGLVTAAPAQEPPTAQRGQAAQTPRAPSPSARDAAARAFLEGAGAGHLTIPEEELAATMERMGRVFASMVAGMREVLMARASIKSEMRMNRTMIGSSENNPLKFSVSPEQAVEAMIRPSDRGYLDAETAATQAIGDIRAHELAMMAGMEAALKDLLVRLDPTQLASRIDTGSSLGGLLGGKKARYWEAYEKMYSRIASETEDNFHSTFGHEFIRAYEDQLKKL
ncbi:type VI secretion system-associated FHA domain protein TagH [Roseibium sp.]|uniref:type VI secretion system-associated FHA domain protein TagH n=1 Tax=Roseibium sp. TaxID=1936156 RepID=UPI003A973B58